MTDYELEEPPELQTPRRGWKRFFIRTLVVIGVLGFGLLLARWQLGRMGNQELTEVVQQIDSSQQNWKLEDIEADRLAQEPPPDQNAAKLVLEIDRQIPTEWNLWRQSAKWLIPTPDNYLPSEKQRRDLRYHQENTASARKLAHLLRERWKGRYQFLWPDNPLALTLLHLDSASRVVSLLEYDARLAAIDQDPNRAIRDAHAALNVSRSIGDEPTLVSQNFRMMFRARAAVTALGSIAVGVPISGLEELQGALLADADEPLIYYGLRGERAATHRMFEGLESGRLKSDLFQTSGETATWLANPAVFEAYKPLLPGDHAEFIRLYSACIDAARLPWHEQLEAIQRITPANEKVTDNRYILTRLMFPTLDHLVERSLRNRAHLLIAATSIACERFRQQYGRWPRELSEIPTAILHALPTSPFDGGPLRYQVLPDRIVLTCYCWKRSDKDQIPVDFRGRKAGPVEFCYPETPGFGIAACVWNPEHRGLPFDEARQDKEKP